MSDQAAGFDATTAFDSAPAAGRWPGWRWVRRGLFTVVAIAVVAAGGFAVFASHVGSLAAPADLKRADAIIVLTGGQSRIDAALGLLKAGKGKRLLISGVHPDARRADLRAATGGDARLFKCCIDIDHVALDTIGNAEESAKWVRSHAYSRIILVTNNYHIPRSLLEMRRLLQDVDLRPYPVVNTDIGGGGWMTRPDALRVLFTEYTKYLAAVARGLLSVSDPTERPVSVAVTVPKAKAD
jgi:uncharacterized SAM-binding protein YcdF (DUF218 family)